MIDSPDVVHDADGATVVWRRPFTQGVDEVWAALTESPRLGRWMGTWTGDPTSGSVSFTVTGEVDAGGEMAEPVTVTILTCEPPHRLVVDFDGWHLDAALAPDGACAALVFAQRLPEGMRTEDVASGWTWYLDRLQASLDGTPMPPWTG